VWNHSVCTSSCQATKYIYSLDVNLVPLKSQYFHGNNSVIFTSILKVFYLFRLRLSQIFSSAQFYFYLHNFFFDSYFD
jgi:hypothetical protein